jgi:hypothetical protein
VTAKPTSTAATSTSVSAPTTTTTAAAKASHLGQTRVNLLLGFLEDIYEITGLLLVCWFVSM